MDDMRSVCLLSSPDPALVGPPLLAAEEPLLLYSCAYGGLDFRRSSQNYGMLRGQLEDALTR